MSGPVYDPSLNDPSIQAPAPKIAGREHGAGANPSTAAGVVVLAALGLLLLMRRGFRSIA